MEHRNAKYIDATRIDCEIEHPVHGWIPYTLDPNDTDTTVDNDALLLAIGDDAVAYIPPTEEELAASLLAKERAGMSCTPLQGKLAIGETLWTNVVVYSATAPWAQQMVIGSADTWYRNSEDIQFIGYLLGVTDAQMDDLFRLAVTL